jgi:oligopeptide transport system substrate-binding protein
MLSSENRPVRLAAFVGVAVLTVSCTLFGGDDRTQRRREQPSRGGKLVVAWREPETIDPSRARATDRGAMLFLKQLCDTLVIADPVTGELKPGAAESWQIAPDAKKVTFKLRAMKFHNGRDVAAADYVYSISRFVKRDAGSREAFLFEKVAGYPDAHEGRTPELAGAKAPDPTTLEIELAEPFAEFPAVMAHPGAGSAIPKEEVDKDAAAFAAKPACTGPYSPSAAWERGKDLTLQRAAGYKGGTTAYSRQGTGYLDQIIFRPFADLEAGYNQLTKNTTDVAEVPNERLTQARQVEGRVESGHSGVVALLGLPVNKPPTDNREYRRALSLAIDRGEIINKVLAGSRGMPSGFLPRSTGPVSRDQVCKDTIRTKADAAKAKEALKASGVNPGAGPINVYYNPDRRHEAWLSVIARQWQDNLGVTATLAARGSSDPNLDAYAAFLVDGADGPFRWAWLASYPSPESILGPTFVGGSLDNYSRFASQEFDDLIKKARATVDDQARRKAYVDAASVLCRELPMVPVWFVEIHTAFRTGIVSNADQRVDIFGDPILRELGRRS